MSELFFILSSSVSVMWLWWTIFCSQNVLMNNLSWIRAELIFCEETHRWDQFNLHRLIETHSTAFAQLVPDSDQSVRSLKNTHDTRSGDVLWLTSHMRRGFISVWQTCHRWCFSAPPHLHLSSGTCLRIMIHQQRNDPHYQLMNLMSVGVIQLQKYTFTPDAGMKTIDDVKFLFLRWKTFCICCEGASD